MTFKVGDEVFCNIRESDEYNFDRTKPLTIVKVNYDCYYLTQPGLVHLWRKIGNTPCIMVDISTVTKADSIKSIEQKVIDKIKYLDKRYADRKLICT